MQYKDRNFAMFMSLLPSYFAKWPQQNPRANTWVLQLRKVLFISIAQWHVAVGTSCTTGPMLPLSAAKACVQLPVPSCSHGPMVAMSYYRDYAEPKRRKSDQGSITEGHRLLKMFIA